MKDLVSIIMLTYNRKKYLTRSIESVLKQKDCNFEFIIIDNGSDDGSKDICKSYADKDKRIKFKSIEKSSIAKGRNIGLEMAEGNYISFVDDDDYMEEDMFSYLLNLIKEDNACISVCGSYYDFAGEIKPFYVFEDIKKLDKLGAVEEFLKRKYYNSANPCKLFKRELFNEIKYKEDSVYDDIHVMYKLFAEADVVISSGVPKYYFERHQSNNSGFALNYKLTPSQLDEYIDAFKVRTEYISKKIPEAEDIVKYSEWSYMISMIDKIIRFEINECKTYIDYFKNTIKENLMEFKNSRYIQDFELEWIKKYVEETCYEF